MSHDHHLPLKGLEKETTAFFKRTPHGMKVVRTFNEHAAYKPKLSKAEIHEILVIHFGMNFCFAPHNLYTLPTALSAIFVHLSTYSSIQYFWVPTIWVNIFILSKETSEDRWWNKHLSRAPCGLETMWVDILNLHSHLINKQSIYPLLRWEPRLRVSQVTCVRP